MEVNIQAAKTHLSKLIERVSMREEIIIGKAGTPVANSSEYSRAARSESLAKAKGLIKMKPGWDSPLTGEELAQFEG